MALASPALALLSVLASALLVKSDEATESQLFNNINLYRSNIGTRLLVLNPGASCLADKLVNHFEHTPCDNTTEAQTSPGLTPDFPDYPNMLSECRLALVNTTGGTVLVDCIPSALLATAADAAVQNFTRSQEYQRFLNSSDFSSVGVASEDNWFVLVLGTRSSDGNYAQSLASQGFVTISSPSTLLLVAILVVLTSLLCFPSMPASF